MDTRNPLFTELFNKIKHVRSLQKQSDGKKSPAILSSVKTHETELDQLLMKIDRKLEARKKINV
jgi:hypothetical protein